LNSVVKTVNKLINSFNATSFGKGLGFTC